MKSSRKTVSFDTPLESAEDISLLCSTKLEAYNSFQYNRKYNDFLLFTEGYLTDLVFIRQIKNLLELRDSQRLLVMIISNDLRLHVNEIRKGGQKRSRCKRI